MKNFFFQNALNKASGTLGRKNRMMKLLAQLMHKSQNVNWKSLNAQAAKSRISVFGRLSKAYVMGHYREIPWKTMLIIVAAIIYFINPIDLLPDLIPITGLTDDFAVLMWVYSSISAEVEKFLAWERSQLTNI